MNILVIDDDPFARKLLTHQLGRLGFLAVQACAGAREALAVLAAGDTAIELIFCDLQMPGMDGVEFVRHLVQQDYRGGLVLVSGEDERILQTAERLGRAHRLTVHGALQKPIAPEPLRQVMSLSRLSADTRPAPRPACYTPQALQRAIDEGQLVNHYQPKVDLQDGRVTGVETLVRWRHPEDGLVYPDLFIPTAEEHGLIDALTRAVLKTAFCDAQGWREEGLALQVAVNISRDNLSALDFPDFVHEAAAVTGFPLSKLVLEVTESRLANDPLGALDILTRLRLKGVGLSIDDFGTGHSSLAQLRDVPFNELKVDRSFVHGASRNPSLRTILQASIGLAHQLGMKAVAEGVEDRDDWDLLCGIGCDLAQGWYVARAMPAGEVADWVQRWDSRRLLPL